MTSKAIFTLLVAFSLPALAQDLPERVERLESTIEVMLVVALIAGMTAMVGFGAYFLAVVFYFSIAGEWVSDFSTVNRAIFHMVPLLAFWMVALVERRFHGPPDPIKLV